jgi:hypothetical protein
MQIPNHIDPFPPITSPYSSPSSSFSPSPPSPLSPPSSLLLPPSGTPKGTCYFGPDDHTLKLFEILRMKLGLDFEPDHLKPDGRGDMDGTWEHMTVLKRFTKVV